MILRITQNHRLKVTGTEASFNPHNYIQHTAFLTNECYCRTTLTMCNQRRFRASLVRFDSANYKKEEERENSEGCKEARGSDKVSTTILYSVYCKN